MKKMQIPVVDFEDADLGIRMLCAARKHREAGAESSLHPGGPCPGCGESGTMKARSESGDVIVIFFCRCGRVEKGLARTLDPAGRIERLEPLEPHGQG